MHPDKRQEGYFMSKKVMSDIFLSFPLKCSVSNFCFLLNSNTYILLPSFMFHRAHGHHTRVLVWYLYFSILTFITVINFFEFIVSLFCLCGMWKSICLLKKRLMSFVLSCHFQYDDNINIYFKIHWIWSFKSINYITFKNSLITV